MRTTNREDLPGLSGLAITPVDANGAPASLFVKCSAVTNYNAEWRSIQRDDPGDDHNPTGPSEQERERHVLKGSSLTQSSFELHLSFRVRRSADIRRPENGFRYARHVEDLSELLRGTAILPMNWGKAKNTVVPIL